jgi:hypothetical protein
MSAHPEQRKLALAYDQSAWLQTQFGRFEEAIGNQRKTIELDPLSLMFDSNFGWRLNTQAAAELR